MGVATSPPPARSLPIRTQFLELPQTHVRPQPHCVVSLGTDGVRGSALSFVVMLFKSFLYLLKYLIVPHVRSPAS